MKILLLSLFILATSLFANIGKISALSGDISLIRDTQTLTPTIGFIINEKDKIKTGDISRAQLVFNDKTIISLGKNSTFDVEEYFFDETKPKEAKANFKVAKGIFKSITGRIGKLNPNKFKLKTKSASIGIRGTVFFGEMQPGEPDNIACTQGSIVVETPNGMVEVLAGQFTQITFGQAPTPPATIPPTKAQELQKNSGAQSNEQESGENEETAEKAKATDNTQSTENEQKEDDKAIIANENDDDSTLDNTPPFVPTEIIETVTNDANDIVNEVENENLVDEVQHAGYSFSDISGDAAPKNATYDVFHTGFLSSEDSYSYTTSDFSTATFIATNGLLSGESTIDFVDSYNTVVESSTLSLDNIKLPNPYSTYMGLASIYELERDGNYGDNYLRYSSLGILTDSKQEFFYIIKDTIEYDGLTDEPTNSYNTIYFGDNQYSYYQNYNSESNILLGGIKSTYDSLPTDGISLYLEPWYAASLATISDDDYEEDYDSSSSYYSNSYKEYDLFDTATMINNIYNYNLSSFYYGYSHFSSNGTLVNWSNKNLLSYDINNYSYSSLYGSITVGKIVDENGIAKIVANDIDLSSSDNAMIDNEVYIYGSEAQGLGGINEYTNYIETFGQFRAEGLASESIITSRGTSSFLGFADGENISLSINKDSDSISGLISTGSYSSDNINLVISGTLGSDAAYITDKTFATLNITGTGTSYQSSINYSEGWLLAIDTDKYITDSNTHTEGISWGMWSAIDDEGYNNIDTTVWVAGVNRVEDMTETLGSDFTGTYIGNFMGKVQGTINGILDPIQSTINLAVNFNTGTINSTINAVTIANDTISSVQNFDTSFSGAIYEGSNTTGMIQGSFYNSGATTAGALLIQEGVNTIDGVYKASKQ